MIEEGWPEAPKDDVKVLTESLVRLAISYITTPGEAAEDAAAERRRAARPVHRQGARVRGRVTLRL